jgi:hypothetical protein
VIKNLGKDFYEPIEPTIIFKDFDREWIPWTLKDKDP